MKKYQYHPQLLAVVALWHVACQELVAGAPSSSTEKADKAAEVPNLSGVLMLGQGIRHKEAIKLLEAFGAKKIEGAYPRFWSTEDNKGGGHHEYYHLPDGTCLDLRIRTFGVREPMIDAYGLGPKGKRYRGKFEWFDDEDKGLVKWHERIQYKLSEPSADANRPEAGQSPPKTHQ